MKLEIKIINIYGEEIKLKDNEVIGIIEKQNKINTINDGFYVRIVKRI